MTNRKDLLIRIFSGIIIVVLLTIIAISKPNGIVAPTPNTNVCKEDSLQNVINQLQIDFENEENSWDNKQRRYEQVLFEYEFGLEHLKNYHTDAYKEFHRIIGYKESYSHEIERENKNRLNVR